MEGRRDDECVGQREPGAVPRPEPGSLPRDVCRCRLDARREGRQKRVHRGRGVLALAECADERLRIGRHWHDDRVGGLESSCETGASRFVVDVVRVEDGDDDGRVEDRQSHSRRSSSR
jgi:hypothetical protein